MSLIIATEQYVAYALDGPGLADKPWDKVNHYGFTGDTHAQPNLVVVGYESALDARASTIAHEIDEGVTLEYIPGLTGAEGASGIILDRRSGSPMIYMALPGCVGLCNRPYVAIGPGSDFALGMLDHMHEKGSIEVRDVFKAYYDTFFPRGSEYWISNHLRVVT